MTRGQLKYGTGPWVAETSEVAVVDCATGRPAFTLLLYGVPTRQLMTVPMGTGPERAPSASDTELQTNVGSALLRRALRRRGLDPDKFVISFLWIEKIRRDYAIREIEHEE